MLRRITLTLALLALVGFGLAQTISPTYGPGEDDIGVDDAGAAGVFTATVTQTVNLKIPPVVALHLDVTNLEFDISTIGTDDPTWACVYGPGYRDEDITTGYLPSGSVLPLGTYYETGTWPNIRIIGHGGVAPIQVTQYPPIALDDDDEELVEGSKNYFVCYRTFILQKFSTIKGWSLSVERDGGTYDMYIQDNTCSDWGAATGLWKLDDDATQSLLPASLTGDTTGALARKSASCTEDGNKSWLDDLVVVAVKVNGEEHGDNTSTLTYSLTATVP